MNFPPRIPSTEDKEAFFKAIKNHDDAFALDFINSYDNVADIMDRWGWSALQEAAFYNNTKIASHLLKEGAKIDFKNRSEETPLMLAVKSGHLEMVSLLLEKGASVTTADQFGKTVLIYAAMVPIISTTKKADKAIVALLLEKNVLINARDSHGQTALMHAASGNYADIVKLLLEKGADINLKNNEGKTALDLTLHSTPKTTYEVLRQWPQLQEEEAARKARALVQKHQEQLRRLQPPKTPLKRNKPPSP